MCSSVASFSSPEQVRQYRFSAYSVVKCYRSVIARRSSQELAVLAPQRLQVAPPHMVLDALLALERATSPLHVPVDGAMRVKGVFVFGRARA
jgi:hypothetical protein